MSKEFRFVKLDNTNAAKLLEAFRLYGTKEGSYTVSGLWLVYALTDMRESFYFTRAYYHAGDSQNDTPNMVEYVLSCNSKLALVRCTMQRVSKLLNILAVHGETPYTQQQLVEIITFFEEYDRGYIYEHRRKWIDWQNLNVARKRRLMLQNREAWEFDLLAKEYSFHTINCIQKAQLWNCICQYGDKFKKHGDAQLGYALTDEKHNFWLTLCFYMSDGIKHCGEPDDYEYAVVTNHTAGVVRVWFQNGVQIKNIKGEIPLTEQKLYEVVDFYARFHSNWEGIHSKLYGRIPKRPDDL